MLILADSKWLLSASNNANVGGPRTAFAYCSRSSGERVICCGTAGDPGHGAEPNLHESGPTQAVGSRRGPQAGEEQPLPAEGPDLHSPAARRLQGSARVAFSGTGTPLRLVLEKRRDKVRTYFDTLAGKFGREYVPGRSWKGLAETLIQLMPPMVVTLTSAREKEPFLNYCAQRAEKVIAVDNSPKMVEFGARLAADNGIPNLEYRLGDLESPLLKRVRSIWRSSVRACIMRCIPRKPSESAWKIL